MPSTPWLRPDDAERDGHRVCACRFEASAPVWSVRFMIGTMRLACQMVTASGRVGRSLAVDVEPGSVPVLQVRARAEAATSSAT